MKKIVVVLVFAMLIFSACASNSGNAGSGEEVLLTLRSGETELTFTAEELQALPVTEATFNDVAFKGVSVIVLVEQLGLELDNIQAVKAVAADGYSVNYDTGQIFNQNVVVAYGLVDGSPLTEDDGTFRMVLPDEEGKLNLRMLVELQFITND